VASTIAGRVTPGVNADTMALFCRTLAALLRAGLPLDDSLEHAAQAGPLHLRSAAHSLANMVRQGQPLSEGIRGYPVLFHGVILAMVRCGERTGNLDESFTQLAEWFEFEAGLTRSVRSAMIYPTIVLITAICAVAILAYINFMPATWAVRLTWALAVAAGLWLILRFRWAQQLARLLVIGLPFFGAIIKELAVARFCHAFAVLIRAGVPYLEGLEAAGPAVQHPIVEMAVRHVYAGVRNGASVQQSFAAQRTFPRIVVSLVAAGETAGNLDAALLKAAQFLRTGAEYKIRNSAKLAGPVMVIIMGIIVALIAIGFWTSYFDKIMGILEE
jgi:MSHA biogenesis protein MshG